MAGVFSQPDIFDSMVFATYNQGLGVKSFRDLDVLESISEGFVFLDHNFRVVKINAGGLRFESRPSEDIVGLTQWEAWPGCEATDVGDLSRRCMAARVPGRLEQRYVWPDGRALWLEVRVYPSGDGLAVFYNDITERRRAEDVKSALLDLGDRLRVLKTPDEIVEVAGSAIGQMLDAAQASYALVHADGDTATVFKPWLRDSGVLSLEGTQQFSQFGDYATHLRRGVSVVVEDATLDGLTIGHRDSFVAAGIKSFINLPLLKAQCLVGMILVSDDRPRTWSSEDLAFLRSVADRTWAALQTAEVEADLHALNFDLEREVERRTTQYDQVWRNSQDLLCILDQGGTIQAANPAWTTLLGWAPAEVVGRNHLVFNHPDDQAASAAALLEAARKNITSLEGRLLHKDGSFHWFSWVASEEGDLVYASGRHITAEKEAAEALHLAEGLLHQSQKMEAVGQLTGGLAHDFNNMLSGISGCLEMIETRVAQGDLKAFDRYVAIAHGGVKRAAALTHRLLAFSRRQTLDPQSTDVNKLIEGMADFLRRTVGPAVQIKFAAAAALWSIRIDPNQLENALLNLCINARDSMPNGGHIVIETENIDLGEGAAEQRKLPSGSHICLSVTDTGVGMPLEVVARAFEPFFTTKPLGQGTGLGLSMIHGFVHQSGGQIEIDSKVGRGTSIRLYLPRDRREAAEPTAPVARAIRGSPGAGGVVLVVDDEATIRLVVKELLEDLGYTVLQASDGSEGLGLLQSTASIDILIADIGLPGKMNGRQLADASKVYKPDLKVLFITGYADSSAIPNEHLDPGMQVMAKPFALEALARKVRDMLDVEPANGSRRESPQIS